MNIKRMTERFFLRPIVISLMLIAGVSPLFAQMINGIEPSGSIPFVVAGDSRIYVTAFVNDSDSLRFLVDTGASHIVLNPKSPKVKEHFSVNAHADNLGTTGSNGIPFSHHNSLRVGSLRLNDVGCAVIEYPADYWDGVLGLNALSLYNIEINYDRFIIFLYPKSSKLPRPKGSAAYDMAFHFGVPFIRVRTTVAGKPHDLTLEIDTGSDRIIDLNTPFVKKHRLLDTQTPFAVSKVASSDNGGGELLNVFFDEVRVGPYRLPLVAGAFSTLTSGMQSKAEVDGMMGNNFLKRFNMAIDFSKNKVYLKPNKLFYSPFYDFLLP